MRITESRIKKFQTMIFTWWKKTRRDLPWRHTRDPYKILVSEVMLQQTQVSRVLPKYREFIKRYPTVYKLAQASPADILRIWKGIGYNRRALYLQRTAKEIVEHYSGEFPKDEQLLLKLPGLGIYTARAILVFAYKQEATLVDTNIRQIITHFFFKDEPQKESIVEEVARQLVPSGKSWEWHQALMDYGAIAMSKLKTQMSKVRKKTIPFHQSNRFFRGRIIDRLREGAVQEQKIFGECVSVYRKSRRFTDGIIASLLKDGLIERTAHGILRLPTRDSNT